MQNTCEVTDVRVETHAKSEMFEWRHTKRWEERITSEMDLWKQGLTYQNGIQNFEWIPKQK